jgi:hypothetical protein
MASFGCANGYTPQSAGAGEFWAVDCPSIGLFVAPEVCLWGTVAADCKNNIQLGWTVIMYRVRKGEVSMLSLVLQAYLKLIYFDLYLMRGDFAALYKRVQRYPIANAASRETVERLCSAVDLACIWYWKEALCLQRSAATSCLLKSHGIFAQMVIGAQQMPFKAHAWVEVDGRVVNDKPYVPEIYAVMSRC